MAERLQKILSHYGKASRRHSEELIKSGRVKVNGIVAVLGMRADPTVDRIEVDGKRLAAAPPGHTYIILNKPKGVLSSTEDELGEGRKTIIDIVQHDTHLYPVGRLDRGSEGLILLTDDGELAHRLTHPRFMHPKLYEVEVAGRTGPRKLERWRRGVRLDGRLTAPAEVTAIRQFEDRTVLRIAMREGRKRQIRRVATILGFEVISLVRVALGPLKIGNLASGKWRVLSDEETEELLSYAGVAGPDSLNPGTKGNAHQRRTESKHERRRRPRRRGR